MKPLSLLLTKAYRQTLPSALLLQYERTRLAKQLATAVLRCTIQYSCLPRDGLKNLGEVMTCSSLALIIWKHPLQETQLKPRIYYNYVGVFIKGARPQQSLVSASIGWI